MNDIVGLDLSLTATGIASEEGAIVMSTKRRGTERLVELGHAILQHCRGSRLVVIEHFGRFQGPAIFIVELHGVVKYLLHVEDIPFVCISAPVLKKFATGKGNAIKGEMLAMAIRRLEYDGFDDNAADAMWLREMGVAWLESRDLHEYQRQAMAKVEWPELREAADA
jgi:Holliday junction resolvasome RuvABC endonuclease subunit